MADETVEAQEQQGAAGAADAAAEVVTAPAAESSAPSEGGEGQAPAPWFSHGGTDFKTAEELTQHLDREVETGRRERLNQEHYTSQLGQLREQQRIHAEAVRRQQEEAREWGEVKGKYEKLHRLMQERPDVAAKINEALGQAPTADAIALREAQSREQMKRELMKDFEPMLTEYKARQAEARQSDMIAKVVADKRTFPHGVDEGKMREEIKRLASSPNFEEEVITLVAKLHARSGAKAPESAGTNGSARAGRQSLPSARGSGVQVPDFHVDPESTFEERYAAQRAAVE